MIYIDSSSQYCHVGSDFSNLWLNGTQLRNHGAELPELMQQTLAAEPKPNAVVVISGPGSYTGLRISCSLAKGLCLGFNIPLIAIDVLSWHAVTFFLQNPTHTKINVVLKARKAEVFYAQISSNLTFLQTPRWVALASMSPDFWINEAFYCGDGCTELLENGIPIESYYETVPVLKNLQSLAQHKLQSRQFENTALFEPLYLKEFFTYTAPV